jgi:sugar lactone lactonase YvrE
MARVAGVLGMGTAAAVAAALLAAGCASSWKLRTATTDVALQWPYQPNAAKVTFVRSLSGLERRKTAGGALKSAVIGREASDLHAFVLPVAVAMGADGRLAVADMGRRSVHLYLPAQERYLELTGPDADRIVSPVGVFFDEGLDLYVSDSAGRVLAFGPGGELRFVIKSAGGEPLRRPTGLAYSPTRKLLYVVDTLANKVHAFSREGAVAFSFGERGDAPGRFNFPTHIFRAAAGELYVTDALNFRVEIFDEDGKVLGTFGHHGDGSGDLAMPKGVAADRDGVVYVVDGIFDNVQLFTRGGDFLLTLGRRGVDLGEFWLPTGVFLSESDELYVCDTYNRRIQVFRVTVGYAQGRG